MTYSNEKLLEIINEATDAANAAGKEFLDNHYGGADCGSCGFAWVNIHEHNGVKIKGNTKLGHALKRIGIEQDYRRVFQIWNPSNLPVQNIDSKEAGAEAAAQVLRKYGFTAYAGSRMD